MVNECIHTLNLFLVKQLEANVQAVFQGTIEGDADPMTTIMTEKKRPRILQTIYNCFDRVESTFQKCLELCNEFLSIKQFF